MSRRDRSPVGNGCGAGFPEPLQGLDGVNLRVSRVSARICPQTFCVCLRGQRAICEGGGHKRFFDEAKVHKLSKHVSFNELDLW